MNQTVTIDVNSAPIEELDVSQASLYETDSHWPYFERLRREAPIHYCKDSLFGPYWSITTYDDIVAIEKDIETFSSSPIVTIADQDPDLDVKLFIAQDPPIHTGKRMAVSAAVSPQNLFKLEPLIRERAGKILDSLPVGEPFNWVDRVSIELTSQTVATLFDFPFEDRRKLIYWSDMANAGEERGGGNEVSAEERHAALLECLETFSAIWQERAQQSPEGKFDFITLMAHSPHFQNMEPLELLGNLILLVGGSNDTTRNSISGGVLMLNENPAEYDKLRTNPELIPRMVSEIIRFQTPLMHQRRTVTQDVDFKGHQFKQGDKIVLWYVSANRDETRIDRPNEFIIDRANANNHLAFGFGVHRCMGSRMGEMQLRVIWEEIQKRFDKVEVVGEARRLKSNYVRGIVDLPVVLHPKTA